MQNQLHETMQAMTISDFGGVDHFHLLQVSKLEIADDEVLIRLESAGVGEWDPLEREGMFAKMTGINPDFPYTLGSEGAGTVERVGSKVTKFRPGDRVYAASFLNSKGGFYAEFAAVNAKLVSPIPAGMDMAQASAFSGVAVTALRGLQDTLQLKPREKIIILGSSGGVGHMAVQLAQRLGAQVIAVASGKDGVQMVSRLGVEHVLDGHDENFAEKLKALCPEGVNAALLLVGGEPAKTIISCVQKGGRAAYPSGAEPAPDAPEGVTLQKFDGEPDEEILSRLNEMAGQKPFSVHISKTFPITDAASAHQALTTHHIGKMALQIH